MSKKRRAITREELPRLLAVAGKRRLVYLTAIYTGLRLGELQKLVWDDVKFDAPRPYILARGITTKNRKDAIIPLHPKLACELPQLQGSNRAKSRPVFHLTHHISYSFKRDLLKAGIEPVDGLGRKLDFHALRKTFATRLAEQGVASRTTQELMRHSDPKLTANTYTDVSQLPTFDAVASLEWEGQQSELRPQIRPQKSGAEGHLLAESDTDDELSSINFSIENKGVSHILTSSVTPGQMVVGTGFEPVKA